jgi:hypothetical protein
MAERYCPEYNCVATEQPCEHCGETHTKEVDL